MHFIDIGANLTDAVFQGRYQGRQAHDSDLDAVLERARSAGVVRTLVTAGTLPQATQAAALCERHGPGTMFSTVGVHPTRSSEVPPAQLTEHITRLYDAITAGGKTVVAVGECGLDYDRLQFSTREQQLPVFEAQFGLAETTGLPLFLHDRNTGGEFARLIRENRSRFGDGVAHSFTGTADDLHALLAQRLYIGVNGCSLKTAENLAVVKQIPLDRIMLETDAPYCGIRRSHASHQYVDTEFSVKDKKKHSREALVKGRCEPCEIVRVCEVVAKIKGVAKEDVARAAFNNTMRVFFPKEAADMGDSPYDLSVSAESNTVVAPSS